MGLMGGGALLLLSRLDNDDGADREGAAAAEPLMWWGHYRQAARLCPLPCAILLLVALLGIYIAAWPNPVPFGGLNQRSIWGVAGDHVLHALAFAILALLLPRLLHPPLPWSVVLAVVVGGAVVTEALQGLLPWKTFDWGDVMANLVGGAVGCGIACFVDRVAGSRASGRDAGQFVSLESV